MQNEIETFKTDELDYRSKALVESGFFPDLKSVAQAKVKVWIGRSLGLSEFQSLTGIYITPKGQIGLAAVTMGSLVKVSGKYNYIIDVLNDENCEISFFRIKDGEEILIGKSIFNSKDAAKCGLANKETFKSYPKNMLLARALANGCRWYAPETICGYYAIEELDDTSFAPVSKTVELQLDGEVVTGDQMNGA